MTEEKETAIRAIVGLRVREYAVSLSKKHLSQVNNPDGVINMKINNVFIAALGADVQYYSALSRSIDSSLGNALEKMALNIAELNYEVSHSLRGGISKDQLNLIAEIIEKYHSDKKIPMASDYSNLLELGASLDPKDIKTYSVDYHLYDKEENKHYLIELKIGGDLDNKKASSEKEALLKLYCYLGNTLGPGANIKLCFATAYNRYGEGKPWTQGRVLQFFAQEELLISNAFWNLICKSDQGYDVVLDEYRKNAHYINEELEKIKNAYLH